MEPEFLRLRPGFLLQPHMVRVILSPHTLITALRTGTNFTGNPTNRDLAPWSKDKFRVADYTSNEVSRLSWFPGHRATLAEQSMELENLELDLLKLFEKLHSALLVFILCNLNCAK